MDEEDIEYLQNRLGEMNAGKHHSWTLKDRALVSRLLIYVTLDFPKSPFCLDGQIAIVTSGADGVSST